MFKSVMQDKDIKDFTAFLISNTDKRKIDEEKMIFVNIEIDDILKLKYY